MLHLFDAVAFLLAFSLCEGFVLQGLSVGNLMGKSSQSATTSKARDVALSAPPLYAASDWVPASDWVTLKYDEHKDRINLFVSPLPMNYSSACPEVGGAWLAAGEDQNAADFLSAALSWGKSGPALIRLRQFVRFFREELGIGGDRLRHMVAREASLLNLSIENNLRPTLQFYLEEMGIGRERVRRMLQRQPSLLCYSVEKKLRAVVCYLTGELGIHCAAVRTMIIRQPSILGSSIETKLRPMVAFLMLPAADEDRSRSCDSDRNGNGGGIDGGGGGGGGLGLSGRQLRRVLVREPSILTLSLENNIRPKLAAFTRALGASNAELVAAVLASPNLLTCSLERRVLPRIARMRESGVLPKDVRRSFRLLMYSEAGFDRWLANRRATTLFLRELGVGRDDLRLIRRRHPSLLGVSVVTISQAAAFLREVVGLSPEQLRRAIVKYPQVLACSARNNLGPTAAFFAEDLGLDGDALRAMLARQPSLLGLSVERNLRPKAAFLRFELQVSPQELAAALEANPSLLEYSLEGRIRPRVEKMRSLRLPVSAGSMRQICKQTDVAFERWLLAGGNGGGGSGVRRGSAAVA